MRHSKIHPHPEILPMMSQSSQSKVGQRSLHQLPCIARGDRYPSHSPNVATMLRWCWQVPQSSPIQVRHVYPSGRRLRPQTSILCGDRVTSNPSREAMALPFVLPFGDSFAKRYPHCLSEPLWLQPPLLVKGGRGKVPISRGPVVNTSRSDTPAIC